MTQGGAALVWLLGVNLATYAAFAWDKRAAGLGGRRVSERRLLQLALAGGSPAAKLAGRRLRHKTRKVSFSRRLNAILALHLVLGALGVVFLAAPRPGALLGLW